MESPFLFSGKQWIILIILIIIAVILGFLIGRISRYIDIRRHRDDAIKRSKSVILGSVYEKIIPFLPDFLYTPKDMVFIGKGFDYLVLDGLSEWSLREIIFLEIKSGKSTLNANEKMIQEVLRKKQIRYEEYRI